MDASSEYIGSVYAFFCYLLVSMFVSQLEYKRCDIDWLHAAPVLRIVFHSVGKIKRVVCGDDASFFGDLFVN